jgi:sugar lactone lactonase YvrE
MANKAKEIKMNSPSKNAITWLTVILVGTISGCGQEAAETNPEAVAADPDVVEFTSPAQYPEGVEWDAAHKRFLVTSLHKGEVGAVKDDGSYSTFATDPRMICSVGIELDPARDRALVCNSDGGAGAKSSKETTGKIAALAVFQLSTGKLIKYVDLAKDMEGGHFCNDIAIGKDGTAYITDSFSPVVYKVDTDYNASVLVKDEAFTGPAFNLNGIVVKDNYLLVDKMNSGQLFKIPLDNPQSFSEVALPQKLEGSDGMLWAPDGSLIVIANNNAHVGITAATDPLNAVFRLTSDDDWKTAAIKGKASTGDVFATTGTLRDGQIYVSHAMLHVLFDPNTKEQLQKFDIVKYNP